VAEVASLAGVAAPLVAFARAVVFAPVLQALLHRKAIRRDITLAECFIMASLRQASCVPVLNLLPCARRRHHLYPIC
jgi:hypothetical protein